MPEDAHPQSPASEQGLGRAIGHVCTISAAAIDEALSNEIVQRAHDGLLAGLEKFWKFDFRWKPAAWWVDAGLNSMPQRFARLQMLGQMRLNGI